MGGVNTPIDIDDLRRNASFGGLYSDGEPTIRAFWKVRPCKRQEPFPVSPPVVLPFLSKVVESFDAEQRRALLPFVMNVGRPPLLYAPLPTLYDNPPIIR